MARESIPALVEDGSRPGEIAVVKASAVGYLSDLPPVGSFVGPGSAVGRLKLLARDLELHLPPGRSGQVVRVAVRDRIEPVEFGQEILALGQAGAADEVAMQATARAGAGAEGAEFDAAGLCAVRAPTDGIFYRRPNPGSPPFVEAGADVAVGTTLGLVEVMKCFNTITCNPEECPAGGRVERILAEDAVEVHLGQVLFLVRPK